MKGIPSDRCNPVNPAREVQFAARGHGVVFIANIDPVAAAIPSGSTYAFVGDAIVKTADNQPYSYNLRYRRRLASAFIDFVTGATAPKRAQPLGAYTVELELVIPGQKPIAVQRPFTIGPQHEASLRDSMFVDLIRRLERRRLTGESGFLYKL